jgi:hypothetical protein
MSSRRLLAGASWLTVFAFERVYAPLTAGLLRPVNADVRLPDNKRHRLDRLYQRLVADLEALLMAVGLKIAA